MLLLQGVTYTHPNRDQLFKDIDLVINRHDKAALIGNNGAGKSTLLQLLAGIRQPSAGTVKTDTPPYYVPQLFGQYNDHTVAQALRIDHKLLALTEILAGQVTEANMTALDDDWGIEERSAEALAHWQLDGVTLSQKMATLSGGQKTKVFLAGIAIHRPQTVLLDEPSNHLDAGSRQILYDFIRSTNATLVVVSHDRTLLNLLTTVYELSPKGVTVYGGNYDFYAAQKAIEAQALADELKSREKALRKAREVEKETLERQQKLDARGKKKQEKSGLPTISMNTLRNSAERSTARIKDVHAGKIDNLSGELAQLRKELSGRDKMKIGFEDTDLHRGKVLVTAASIHFSYGGQPVWPQPLSFVITSGARIAIKGSNGSGKTTLVRILLQQLQPSSGSLQLAAMRAVYIDQDYSLIDNRLNVYQQAQQYNAIHLEEHELKSRLTHFLFAAGDWDKPCAVLSGGEKMRLLLCCLTLGPAPDMMILDEPTNNLDMQNTDILTTAIRDYRGTLLVISHDAHFLQQLNVHHSIDL